MATCPAIGHDSCRMERVEAEDGLVYGKTKKLFGSDEMIHKGFPDNFVEIFDELPRVQGFECNKSKKSTEF